MASNRLLQYIATLTEEERDKFRPLIDDALRRDQALAEIFGEARTRALGYAEALARLVEMAEDLHASLSRLNEQLVRIAEASERALGALKGGAHGIAAPSISMLRH